VLHLYIPFIPQPGEHLAVNENATSCAIEVIAHMLCHTYATYLLEDVVKILTVQKLPGHASFDSTLIYLHVCELPQLLP